MIEKEQIIITTEGLFPELPLFGHPEVLEGQFDGAGRQFYADLHGAEAEISFRACIPWWKPANEGNHVYIGAPDNRTFMVESMEDLNDDELLVMNAIYAVMVKRNHKQNSVER
ncbi:MAG TPA: hypothetical protein VMR51_01600 [Patescibacteria group bacterium]|nr:hypothetical protein [Patescibacteria group bacterium]